MCDVESVMQPQVCSLQVPRHQDAQSEFLVKNAALTLLQSSWVAVRNCGSVRTARLFALCDSVISGLAGR